MTTMIQIRNVPDTLHRKLKSRAALAGIDVPLATALNEERAALFEYFSSSEHPRRGIAVGARFHSGSSSDGVDKLSSSE